MIRFLLLLYPARWRKEYGMELAEVLRSRSLTPRIAADVSTNAVRQRIRYAPVWLLAGIVLLTAAILHMALLLLGVLPVQSAHWVFAANVFSLLVTSFLTAIRRDGSFVIGISAALKAALLGFSPWWIDAGVSLAVNFSRHAYYGLPPSFILWGVGRAFVWLFSAAALSGALGALFAVTIRRFRGRLA